MTNASRTTGLAASRLNDARGENSRPRRSSISIRSPKCDERPKSPTANSSRDLVRIGFLHVIDHKDLDRTPARFQPESELLLERGEDGGASGIHWWPVIRSVAPFSRDRCPQKLDIVVARQTRLIDNRPA